MTRFEIERTPKVFLNVKYEKVIINSDPDMNINAYLHLTLKLEMSKVKVKDKGGNGKCSSRHINMWRLKEE